MNGKTPRTLEKLKKMKIEHLPDGIIKEVYDSLQEFEARIRDLKANRGKNALKYEGYLDEDLVTMYEEK
ncbi:MAG: hypothetical protein KAJ10_05220 [Thermodesulfovibrionia bacterium]|nr:hypothetical protein [Thermodesulfovibrionia bacterium]